MKNKENERYLKIGITGAAIAAFGIAFFFVIYRGGISSAVKSLLLGILRPFSYGAVMAYVITPLANWLGKRFHGRHDTLANVLAVVIGVLIVSAVLTLIIPQLINSLIGIIQAAPGQFESLKAKFWDFIRTFNADHPQYAETVNTAVTRITEAVDKFWKETFGSAEGSMNRLLPILTGAASQVGSTMGVLKDLLLGLFVTLYLLPRRAQLAAQAVLMLRGTLKPTWADWVEREVHFADRMFNGFFVGKLLDSAIIGVLCFAGCVAMGFSSPLLIAVIVGVTNIIPFFGPFIGAIPCTLLLLLEEPMHALMFVIFIIVLQQLDGNVIGPKILGDSTGLSALWVMFGILLFGGLWGVPGMIVGVPLMALIYDVIRQLTREGLRRHGRDDLLERYNARFHSPAAAKPKRAPFWKKLIKK